MALRTLALSLLAVTCAGSFLLLQPEVAQAQSPEPILLKSGTNASTADAVIALASEDRFDDIAVKSVSDPDQAVLAFSVFQGEPPGDGGGTSLAPGEISTSINRSSIVWVASNYLDVKRPATMPSSDAPRQRAAAQLAIWALSDGSFRTLDGHQPDPVLDLRDVLLAAALEHEGNPAKALEHVDFGSLTSQQGERFFEGETLRLSVDISKDDQKKDLLPRQILTIYNSNGSPFGYAVTNDEGLATVQIPWKTEGPLMVRWDRSLPPGTFVQLKGSTAILSQAIQFRQQLSIVHTVTFADRAGYAWSVASRELNGKLGLIVGVILGLGLLLGAFVVANAHVIAKTLGVGIMVAAVAIVLLGTYLLSNYGQSQRFKPRIDEPSPTSYVPDTVDIKTTTATSTFSNTFPAACAFDDDDGTAWISGRGQGDGEFLAVIYSSALWIDTIAVKPGLLDSWRRYQTYGFPSTVQVFTADGEFAEFPLERDAPLGDDLDASLENARRWRVINLPSALHADRLWIRVAATDPGKFSYAISEVRPGWSSGGEVTYTTPIASGC